MVTGRVIDYDAGMAAVYRQSMLPGCPGRQARITGTPNAVPSLLAPGRAGADRLFSTLQWRCPLHPLSQDFQQLMAEDSAAGHMGC